MHRHSYWTGSWFIRSCWTPSWVSMEADSLGRLEADIGVTNLTLASFGDERLGWTRVVDSFMSYISKLYMPK